MTFRSRMVCGLLSVLVVLSLAPSSFAQLNITLTSFPSPSEIQTNRNAQTADPGSVGAGILVSASLLATSPLTTTSLRISFPAPITSSPASFGAAPSIPTNDPIRIEGATGIFATVSNPVLNTTNSRIEITLPGTVGDGGINPNSESGSFRLVGVRIDANGKTGAQSATAALNNSSNNYILTNTSVTVISALAPGIGSFAIGARTGQTNQGTAAIFTNRTVPDPTGSVVLTEGFASAFRTATQASQSGAPVSNGTNIRLTFNNVPTGVTLALSTNTTGALAAALSNTNITTTVNSTTVTFSGTSLTTTETLEIDFAVVTPLGTTAAVTTPGTVTATATFLPIGDGVNNDNPAALGLPRQDQGYPSFLQADTAAVTVVNIAPASTTMLVPYALALPPYDTGIAIANTTADPFGATGGGAVASSGTITVNFYPTATAGGAGTASSFTTSSTVRPGAGLSADGTLAAGATWTALLTQLLTAAGQTGNFVGYIFVQANFLNGHGTATISDFRTYSLAANVLILPPPATSSRATPAGNAEVLGN